MEDNMQIFIDAIVKYFSQISDKKIEVGSPYLVETNDIIVSDYTGVISISGTYEGCCYFTTPRVLLKYLILALGEIDTSDKMLMDAVGEVANTLSGNARKDLGKDFIISIPTVFKGIHKTDYIQGEKRTYSIPIICNSYKAMLGIQLSQSSFIAAA